MDPIGAGALRRPRPGGSSRPAHRNAQLFGRSLQLDSWKNQLSSPVCRPPPGAPLMTRTLPRTPLLAAAASFAAMLAVLVVVMGAGRDPVATGAARRLAATPDAPRPGAAAGPRTAVLQAPVGGQPTRADGYTLLAGAYRQKVRETGDATFYAKADGVVARALRLAPGEPPRHTQRAAPPASPATSPRA